MTVRHVSLQSFVLTLGDEITEWRCKILFPSMSRALTTEEAHAHRVFNTKVKLQEVNDVRQVNVLMREVRYSVRDPIVYRISGTDSVLIFGEPTNPIHIKELRRMYEDKAVREDDGKEVRGLYKKLDETPDKQEDAGVNNKKDGRLSEEDISLISSQVDASRGEIIKALVDSDYDVVNAMMKLTK